MVLIRHECGAQSHWDWMLCPSGAPSDPQARALVSWRAWSPIHESVPESGIDIEEAPAHRVAYLALAGAHELSGGRGRVEPVARGLWAPAQPGRESPMELRWEGGWTGLIALEASMQGPSWRRLTACRHQGP